MSSDEVPDEVKEQVDQFCENKGLDLDQGRQAFMEVADEIREHDSGLPDERVYEIALQTFGSDVVAEQSDGSETINFIAYGSRGFRQQPYRDDDGNLVDEEGNPIQADGREAWEMAAKRDVLDVIGVAPIEGSGWCPVSLTFDSDDGVDLDHALNVCTFGTGVETKVFRTELDEMNDAFRAFSTSNTSVEEGYSDVPEDEDERVEQLREMADPVSLKEIHEGLSATRRADNGNEYLLANGIDVKYLEGSIVDHYKDDVKGTYIYTVLDELVMEDAEEIDALAGESQRTPGLTCWTNSSVMKYGEGTVGEFFGSVSQDDEGRITMQLYGINIHFPRPLDEDGDEEGGENVDSMSLS